MDKKIKPIASVVCGIICFILLTFLDQITKRWAVLNLRGREPIVLIDNIFELYYLENHGAAFGILQGQRNVFIVITIVILAVLVYIYARLPFTKKYRLIRVFLVLISAGAVGNFIDRVTHDYVVDFFYFVLIDFPVFNVADICVTCSTVLLILVVLFKLREDDFTEILQSLGFGKKKSSDHRQDPR